MWDNIAYLESEVESLDSKNRVKKTIVQRMIYCNKKSVGSREFYQASQQGLKPSIILEIHTFEYNNQEHLTYNSKRYRIIRSYDKTGEKTELTCEGLVNG